MAQEKQVRIIKRVAAQDDKASLPEERNRVVQDSGRTMKREVGRVVTGWVREMRRKKLEESTRSFESLFGKAA